MGPHDPLPDAPPPPRRRWRRALILTALAGAALFAVVATPNLIWYLRFRHRLGLAEEHAPVVQRALANDPRVHDLKVAAETTGGGTLWVSAVVEPGASAAIREIVFTTSPPVRVEFDLLEIPETTQPATRPAQPPQTGPP